MKKIKLLILSVLSIVTLIQCDKSEEEQTYIQKKSFFNSIKVKKLHQIENKKNIKKKLDFLLKNKLNRSLNDNNFTIDTTNVQILNSDYYTNYTLLAKREIENENFLDNYILTVFNDSLFHQMIISYPILANTPSQEVYDTKNAIATEIQGEILFSPKRCAGYITYEWETQIIIHNCTAGGNHTIGEVCEGTPEQLPWIEVTGTWVSTCHRIPFSITESISSDGRNNGGGSTPNATPNFEDPNNGNLTIGTVPFKPNKNNQLINDLNDELCEELSFQQENWINQNVENAQQILTYLQNDGQDCSNINFNELLENKELSDNSPFELDIFDPMPNDSTPEAKKLTESPKFKSLFENTFGETEDFKVKFEIDDLPVFANGDRISGTTEGISLTDFSIQTIKIDRYHMLNSHPLSIAQTIIHESLHAFMNIHQQHCYNQINPVLTQPQIDALNQFTMDELLNDFQLNCSDLTVDDHRLLYSQMLNVMNEMLTEVFDDLVASEDLSYNYWLPAAPEQFTWSNAIHNLNLSGLQKANEFIDDDIQSGGILTETVSDYAELINDSSIFNHNTCN